MMAMHRPPWRSSAGGTALHATPSGYDAFNADSAAKRTDHTTSRDRHVQQSQPQTTQQQQQHQRNQPQQPWFDPATDVIVTSPVSLATQRHSTSSNASSSSGNSATSRRALRQGQRGQEVGQHYPSSDDGEVKILVAFTFFLELVVLIGLSVFEYYLRVTDYFPIRETTFRCSDPDINYLPGQSTYNSFAYQAEIPYLAVIIICFCLPPFIMSVGELALWVISPHEQKTISVLCRVFRLPLPFRRMLRFTGAFLFGLLVTMIFVDVTKIMTGRLRPTFLNTCQPNRTLCLADGDLLRRAADICSPLVDPHTIRVARQSFPSMQAAITSFSACFTAVYLHNVLCAGHKARIIRLFLSLGFIMMSLLCSLARYGLFYNHWVDVAVGFGVGIVLAVYIGAFVLNNFHERLTGRRLYDELQRALVNDDELHVVPASWLTAPPGEVIGSNETANIGTRNSAINYAWLPGQAAIIIPRPRLKNDAENGAVNHAVDGTSTDDIGIRSTEAGPWHTAAVP